jgi:hypothetical protein
MDPNAAWLTACEWHNDLWERADAAASLIQWTDRGGHVPTGTDLAQVRSMCGTLLAQAWSTR